MSGNPNNNANIGFVGEANRNIDHLNDGNQTLGFINEHNANMGFGERKHNMGFVNDGNHNIGLVNDGNRNIGLVSNGNGNTGFVNEGPSRLAPLMPQPPVGADFDRVLASLPELHPDQFFNLDYYNVIEADGVFNVGPMFENVPQNKRPSEPTQEMRQVRPRVQTTAPPPPFPALGNIPSGNAEALVKAPEPVNSAAITSNAADIFKTPLVTLLVGRDETRIQTHKGFLDRSEYFKKRLAETDTPNELKLVKETPEDVYKMVAWLCLGKYEPKAINPASPNANKDYLHGLILDYGLASKYEIQAIRTQIVVGNPKISDLSWDHLVSATDRKLRGTRMWNLLMKAVRSDSLNRPDYLENLLWDGLAFASEDETDDDDDAMPE